MLKLGIDIGSTTIKYTVLDESNRILDCVYQRHGSNPEAALNGILDNLLKKYGEESVKVALSGSAGMGIAERVNIPFVQEVYAEQIAVKTFAPNTDTVIELGGEDAKILFLHGGVEMRMNGTCAGGTGAFIDQMSSLLQVTPAQINELAKNSTTTLRIASRCGVFAKSDVQPMLNQGMPKEDIAAGIFRAVVDQTVAGLSQGRKITGNVLYLGGPLTFLSSLREAFDKTLGLTGLCPENSLYFVAMGSALSDAGKTMTVAQLKNAFETAEKPSGFLSSNALFASPDEYDEFRNRHKKSGSGIKEIKEPVGEMFLGIDAGSTTVKAVLCDKDGNIFKPFYSENHGDPVELIKKYIEDIYCEFPQIKIASSAVTGYGEKLLQNAFSVDFGIVETVAHYTAARKFRPDVDFILDIGGQDIKCFKIRNGLIDSLYLNEACSSGCGSFLQTFAANLGYTNEEFAKLGLFAKAPVNLGSRCTVFMNSAVKQSQKDGAEIGDIAAGLSQSVVKNALYKVIRCGDASTLGEHIVVQGGTFLNDCVLRAFEQETTREVIRPSIAGLMGAYGSALYALNNKTEKSSFITKSDLVKFQREVVQTRCGGCENRCHLTVNTFSGNRKFVAGNRCSKFNQAENKNSGFNLYEQKLNMLEPYMKNETAPDKLTVGIPLGLNNYELLPFWYTFFNSIGLNVLVSPFSNRKLYISGQHSIPSDTACYPAKLMHGHIEWLIKQKPDFIFYPDMSYNFEEKFGVDHFNCPVVAYYPQVIKLNVPEIKNCNFICDFLSLAERKSLKKRLVKVLSDYAPGISPKNIGSAIQKAYDALENHRKTITQKGLEGLEYAKEKNLPVVVLCGRPYHIDPEINHGIDKLISDLGAVIVTEDSLSPLTKPFETDVRNQWTYHARMYAAAKFIANSERNDIHLIQLVSFGCGVDAITTDEVRSILENADKDYTQLKIDEISNMGAVAIRLRSLFAMLKEKNDKL